MKVEDAIELFITYREAENLSRKTISWYRKHLKVFVAWLPDACELAAVRSADVARYMSAQSSPDRHPRPLAPYTVRGRYSTLRAFFTWVESSDDLDHLPSPIGYGARKMVKTPRTGEPSKHFVPYEHYLHFVASITQNSWQAARDRLLATILFWTGLRLQECADLYVGDVDVRRQLLYVRQGKGRKARFVPFDGEIVRPALLDYLWSRPAWEGKHLWLGQTHDRRQELRPLLPEGIRQLLVRRCRKAHLPYYNPHSWRHAYGMWLINCGASMAAVSMMMGHSTIETTERVYSHMQTAAAQREYVAAVAWLKERGNALPNW